MPVVGPPTPQWGEAPTDQPPQLALHLYRPLGPLGSTMNALFGVLLFALLAGVAANAFLFTAAAPDHKWFDTALRVDERMFLILPVQLTLFGAIYVVLLAWLYRAVANQAAFGAQRTRLAPAEALALAFVPVVNLFAVRAALTDVWRSADPRLVPGDRWRSKKATGRLNWVWAAPLLSVAVNVATAIVASNRLGSNGIAEADTLDEAKFLYASRGFSILAGMVFVNAVRRVLKDVSDRQDSAAAQLRVGRQRGVGLRGPAPAPVAAGSRY